MIDGMLRFLGKHIYFPFSESKQHSELQGREVSRIDTFSPVTTYPPSEMRTVSKRIIPIVSFDGGGTRGVYTLELAVHLEDALRDKLKQPSLKLVDAVKYVGGTSVGGIIALGMAKGYSMHEINDLFNKHIPEIFSRDVLSDIDYIFCNKPRYSRSKLDALAKELFQGKEAKSAVVPFAVTTTQLNEHMNVRILTREQMHEGFYGDALFEDLVNMTSAAPTYFAPYEFRGEYFTDGGVSLNNPEVATWSEARNYYGPDNEFVMCSFGTGITPTPLNQNPSKESYDWGWATWVNDENILNAVLNGSSMAAEAEMQRIFGAKGRNYRMQTIMNQNIPLDTTDPKLLEQLREEARTWIQSHQRQWDEMVDVICEAWQQTQANQ